VVLAPLLFQPIHNLYWVYDGTDTGSQHQAKWTPFESFITEWKSTINDMNASEMGQGGVGLIAPDNKIVVYVNHYDGWGYSIAPGASMITQSSWNNVTTGWILINGSAGIGTNNEVYKNVSNGDIRNYKIVKSITSVSIYESGIKIADTIVNSEGPKIALIAGTYADISGEFPFLDYVQVEKLKVRKYASPEPSVSVGAEKGFCDSTPPASITNLTNVSYAQTHINWTWTDPADLDFVHVSVWMDGVFKDNVSKGMQFYNATGFALDTEHTIATRTVDTSGNINQTWVNHTARTAPEITPCAGSSQYYRDITISNPGAALSDYQVLVNLTGSDFPANAQTSGADIRFMDADGAELSYWFETWDYANRSALVWVKVSSLPAISDTSIRMHYGNPDSTDSSNGDATFVFFDDFNTFDTAKWAGKDNYSVSSSQLTVRTGSVYSKTTVASQPGLISEAMVKWNNFAGYSGLEIADSLSTQQYNYGSNKLVYLMTSAGGSAYGQRMVLLRPII